MALVKKGPFFMAFYNHKTLIIISYHFYDPVNHPRNQSTSL